MIVAAKITSKGQVTLPKEIRKLLNVGLGSMIVFEKEDNKVIIRTAKTLREFKGFLKGRKNSADFAVLRRKAKEYVGRKVAHVKRSDESGH